MAGWDVSVPTSFHQNGLCVYACVTVSKLIRIANEVAVKRASRIERVLEPYSINGGAQSRPTRSIINERIRKRLDEHQPRGRRGRENGYGRPVREDGLGASVGQLRQLQM